MTDFVNFITDKIRPEIIQAYLDGPGTEEDLYGTDSSTADFTKFGYVAAVYRDMLRKGTATESVKEMVGFIGNIEKDGVKNYEVKSSTGYSIAEMMVYDGRNDSEFCFSDVGVAVGDDFMDYVRGCVVQSAGSSTATPAHMMVEYKLVKALSEFGEDTFKAQVGPDAPAYLGSFLYSLKRYSDSNGDVDRRTVFETIRTKVNLTKYNEILGPNNTVSSDGILTNEISKFVILSANDTIERVIDDLIGLVDGSSIGISANAAAVTKADGLSSTSVTFDLGIYQGEISHEKDMGYNPMFYYANKFKSSSRPEILTKLNEKFSPYTISVVDGDTEGFNAIGVLAASLSLSDDGIWNAPELVEWIKNELTNSTLGMTAYKAMVAIGNVRDMTGGSSINAFGAVTNILRAINGYHKAQVALHANEDGYEFDPTPLLNSALPEIFDAAFYTEWMVEYGQEP